MGPTGGRAPVAVLVVATLAGALAVMVRSAPAVAAERVLGGQLYATGDMVEVEVEPATAGEYGTSWTPVDPRSIGPGSYRDLAGLPDSNPGTHLVQGELTDKSGVIVRPALACGPPYCATPRPGGLAEYVILSNPTTVINRSYSVLSPPY